MPAFAILLEMSLLRATRAMLYRSVATRRRTSRHFEGGHPRLFGVVANPRRYSRYVATSPRHRYFTMLPRHADILLYSRCRRL